MTQPYDSRQHNMKRQFVEVSVAADDFPEQQAAKQQKLHQEESRSMPEKVYPILWSFLLDSSNTSETDGCLLDFKSIASLMLVSRASKEAFDACRGWLICAQVLEQEADNKRQILRSGIELLRCSMHLKHPTRLLVSWYRELTSWLDKKEKMLEINARIIRIHSEFSPQARRLADSYGCYQVYMHPVKPKESALLEDCIKETLIALEEIRAYLRLRERGLVP